jgi:hypothetical protein
VKPYRLLSTTDQNRTFRDALDAGDVTYHVTLLEAANAFVKAHHPYRVIVYDDGHHARHLTDNEQQLLAGVCAALGHELEDAD